MPIRAAGPAVSANSVSAAGFASPIAIVNPAAPVALTPAEAHSALQVLEDPVQRARVEDTLRAIAAAGALATPPAAPSAPAPASAPAGASTGASAAAASSAASAPLDDALRSNGLVLQVSTHVAHAMQALTARLLHSRKALFDLPSARAWWSDKLHTPQGHALLFGLVRILLLTFIPALLIEALLKRFVKRPYHAVAAHAATLAKNGAGNDGTHDDAHAANGIDDTQPDGDTAGTASTADAEDDAHSHHWKRLQRLPAAIFVALLNLLPILAFGLCAAAVLSWCEPDAPTPAHAVGALVDTYVTCRVVLALSALLFAPHASSLRMLPLSNTWAVFAQRWATWIVIVGGLGGALNAATQLGLTEDAHLVLVKIIALVGHLMLAAAILQCRRPVAATIRRTAARRHSLTYLSHWFADIWAGAAVFVVMALWLVWAFDVRGGYRELVRSGGLSLVVLLGARLVAIVALGALGRIFNPNGDDAHMSIARQRAGRYYPMLRRLSTLFVGLVTLDVLLQVWDIHVTHLFVSPPVERLLGSAVATIVIALVVAVVIWESANVIAERRLDAWTQTGDYVRAARLRTLLPMLRTSLLVAILVIVGLTALSQLGINTAPLVAGASIFGVALGFGSQKLVQDFITGIFLLTENAMQVGDSVTVAGVSGTVEFLSIRTVRLRGGDGSLYTVPFSSVTTVNNSNRGIGNAAVKVVVAYGADVARAIETLHDIGRELRAADAFKNGILGDFSYWGVDEVDGSGVTLVGQIQCTDGTRWSVQREFNRRVLDRFAERGIELANPQRSVLVEPHAIAAQRAPDDPQGGMQGNSRSEKPAN
ncbi:mechanosensitive ion channel family protein [Burkholderia sp. WAC0059]|uniref:mechanosensitive ion channel family protein n=1 Tax=Burkholderia sp. WAC0059 TaxID=2066022 RepID=UPI0011AF5DFA|nr:mechanosensitive ion channel family protein [Burkholderia sp. WAC0059]